MIIKVINKITGRVYEVFDIRHSTYGSEFYIYLYDRWRWVNVNDFRPIESLNIDIK